MLIQSMAGFASLTFWVLWALLLVGNAVGWWFKSESRSECKGLCMSLPLSTAPGSCRSLVLKAKGTDHVIIGVAPNPGTGNGNRCMVNTDCKYHGFEDFETYPNSEWQSFRIAWNNTILMISREDTMGYRNVWCPISDRVVTDRGAISIRGFGSTDCELQIEDNSDCPTTDTARTSAATTDSIPANTIKYTSQTRLGTKIESISEITIKSTIGFGTKAQTKPNPETTTVANPTAGTATEPATAAAINTEAHTTTKTATEPATSATITTGVQTTTKTATEPATSATITTGVQTTTKTTTEPATSATITTGVQTTTKTATEPATSATITTGAQTTTKTATILEAATEIIKAETTTDITSEAETTTDITSEAETTTKTTDETERTTDTTTETETTTETTAETKTTEITTKTETANETTAKAKLTTENTTEDETTTETSAETKMTTETTTEDAHETVTKTVSGSTTRTTTEAITKVAMETSTDSSTETKTEPVPVSKFTTLADYETTARGPVRSDDTTITPWNVSLFSGTTVIRSPAAAPTSSPPTSATGSTGVLDLSREQRCCRCKQVRPTDVSTTTIEQEKTEMAAVIRKELTVPANNVSSRIRRKTSARDSRDSSTAVGVVVSVVCVLPISLFVLADVLSILRYVSKKPADPDKTLAV